MDDLFYILSKKSRGEHTIEHFYFITPPPVITISFLKYYYFKRFLIIVGFNS